MTGQTTTPDQGSATSDDWSGPVHAHGETTETTTTTPQEG